MTETNSKQYKLVLNLILFLSSFAYGLNYSLFGQTADEVQKLLNLDPERISYVFTIRSAAYCFGSLFYLIIFEHFNRQLVFGVNWLLIAVSMGLTPMVINYPILIMNQAITGLACGGNDVAVGVLVLEMWESDSNPYLQFTFLGYTIGSTITPLISAPFVHSNIETETENKTRGVTENVESSDIVYPYLITASVAFLLFVLIFAFETWQPYKTPQRSISRKNRPPKVTENESSEQQPLMLSELPNSYYVVFIALASLTLSVYLAVDNNFFWYLPQFIINLKIVDRSTNSYMNSVFSGVFTVYRIIAIFVAFKLKPAYMIYKSLVILLIAQFILLLFGGVSVKLLWIHVILSAMGCAWIYPALMAFFEKRIDVTNAIGALFIFSCSVVSTFMPLIFGETMETTPLIFVYVNIACVITALLLLISMNATDSWKKQTFISIATYSI